MTILTGGTLGYLNTHTYLCQGRDATLGPRIPTSPSKTPANPFLAIVIRAGTANREGIVEVGETRLVRLDDLKRWEHNLDNYRPGKRDFRPLWVSLDEAGTITKLFKEGETAPADAWQVKLSGRPINMKGKREGLFRSSGHEIRIPSEHWEAYSERNKHGDRPDLKKGDLVWLEPSNPDAQSIQVALDIASLQWARWGKRGQKLADSIRGSHSHVMPDYLNDDDKVDMVTDLFGQVSPERGKAAPSFAGRVLAENLVFHDCKPRVKRTTLAPLAPPHPGCVAFYRDNEDPDSISASDPMKGYKVYRTTKERGADGPWNFAVQGTYGDDGSLMPLEQKVNKTAELLPEECVGKLSIAFHALTRTELALLIQACSLPWRLGGGKPLGLGACGVRLSKLLNEEGMPMQVEGWSPSSENPLLCIDGWRDDKLIKSIESRVNMWIRSQEPVDKLRYPRAVDENNHRKSRGGHVWFQRHAKPRMSTREAGKLEPGLSPMYIDGPLLNTAKQAGATLDASEPMVAGQLLPKLKADSAQSDLLFGHDAIGVDVEIREKPSRRVFHKIEVFDPGQHRRDTDKSSGNQNKDRNFRNEQKQSRDQK